jgi:hypothetical protein
MGARRVKFLCEMSNIKSPGASIALWITGGIFIAVGLICVVAAVNEHDSSSITMDLAFAVVGLSSGFAFLGIGSILDRLHRIEMRLRGTPH